MEQYISNAVTFYQKKDTGEYFSLKEKKGFMVTLIKEDSEEEIKTTTKKLESDYELMATTIHPEKEEK